MRAEIGHSPMAYIAGTPAEMRRLSPKGTGRGFGGDHPQFWRLAAEEVPGRESDEQITYYHNIGSQGLQYSSVGGLVYRKARAAGRVREVPPSGSCGTSATEPSPSPGRAVSPSVAGRRREPEDDPADGRDAHVHGERHQDGGGQDRAEDDWQLGEQVTGAHVDRQCER
ncbi:MAG: hypothetical protein M3Q22_05090, partial [Actinomycetota bacterium]|nr:hypothetical protein [Actinomycetota bacterium]